jgi:GTP-binding protein
MALPKVVIVGRPNVGKSSLFNWLVGKRVAITDATAGVTRDRIDFVVHYTDRYFELVDTGGIGFIDPDNLTEHIEEQIQVAIDQADVVVFVVDARDGLTAGDWEIDKRLRKVPKPIIFVVNKCDSEKQERAAEEFHALGRSPMILCSAQNNHYQDDVLLAITKALPEAAYDEAPAADPVMKLAIVGRRNVGKSTFINQLAQQERCIVSEVAGTTRDSIDVRFELDGKTFLAIDTPGLRRRKSVNTSVDFYGLHRAQRSIRRANVVLMFFDSAEEISKVDKQLVDYIHEEHRPCIFVVNKWDLCADKAKTSEWADYLLDTFPSMKHVPVVFVTAKEGRNTQKLINLAQELFKQSESRVSTGELNRVIKLAVQKNPPPMHKSARGKIYYGTQTDVSPPTIVLFVNQPAAFTNNWRKYMQGFLRETLPFAEVPIRVFYRSREGDEGRARKPQGAKLAPGTPELADFDEELDDVE